MTVRGTRWVLVAFTLVATLVGARSLARAADDLIPPRLACVDGVFTTSIPRPGAQDRVLRRRWLCDIDGTVNGVCTFGRRCRRVFTQSLVGPGIRCRVRVPVAVGELQPQGRVTLACFSTGTRTPCGPSLSCDTATELCVASYPRGPAIVYGCVPVPAGCEGDRSCRCAGASLCQGAFSTCVDAAPNAIDCICPACQ